MSLASLQSVSNLYQEFSGVIKSINDTVLCAQNILNQIALLQANPNYAGNVSAAEATRLANCVSYFTNMINNAP